MAALFYLTCTWLRKLKISWPRLLHGLRRQEKWRRRSWSPSNRTNFGRFFKMFTIRLFRPLFSSLGTYHCQHLLNLDDLNRFTHRATRNSTHRQAVDSGCSAFKLILSRPVLYLCRASAITYQPHLVNHNGSPLGSLPLFRPQLLYYNHGPLIKRC